MITENNVGIVETKFYTIEEYEQLKKEQIKKFGNIDQELIEEFYLSFISLIKLEVYARDNPNSYPLHNSTIQSNLSISKFENYLRPCRHLYNFLDLLFSLEMICCIHLGKSLLLQICCGCVREY